jgi:MarR family transcriptional regulator, transcriptional regulator for hemolysin
MQERPGDESRRKQQPVSTLIHEISLMVARLFNRQVKDMGLTRTQWQVLYLLYMQGEQTQTNIADTLMMSKPPLGKVVERLETGGWIERRDDSKDRRAKLVCLTPKIQPMLNSLESLVDDIGGIATRGMSEQEAAQFYELLKLAHANLMAEN